MNFLKVLVVVLLVGLSAVPLSRALAENRVALHVLGALPVLERSTFWRGAGLRSGDDDVGTLMVRAYQTSEARATCSEREAAVLSAAVGTSRSAPFADSRGRMTQLAHARQLECSTGPEAALRFIDSVPDPETFDLQRVAFLHRLGADRDAADIVLRHVCAAREPWCVWSLLGETAPDVAGANDPIWRKTNDPSRPSASLLRRLAPLDVRTTHKITVEGAAPQIVTRAVPLSEGDNYLEYETMPVEGRSVRFRVRGAVLGQSASSCLHLRLVLWSDGRHAGEVELPYAVTERFEIDLWATLPEATTTLTPRLTFDSACLSDGRRIAIGAAELGFAR
jgi:hypothetical protein